MIGATARAEQFQGRSGSESTKGSRKGYNLLGWGESPLVELTESQKRQNMRTALISKKAALEMDLSKANALVRQEAQFKKAPFHAALRMRDEVKVEYAAVLAELSALRTACGPRSDPNRVEAHFIDICRETLTRAQFDMMMAEAVKRASND